MSEHRDFKFGVHVDRS